jgi:hypothetical protein
MKARVAKKILKNESNLNYGKSQIKKATKVVARKKETTQEA